MIEAQHREARVGQGAGGLDHRAMRALLLLGERVAEDERHGGRVRWQMQHRVQGLSPALEAHQALLY
ncbi:MAG TPA: hypothetical protein DEP45_01070 [Armatimonadetes bacterium]|nr:hypothetical protein [Armatimonadota bacterium]